MRSGECASLGARPRQVGRHTLKAIQLRRHSAAAWPSRPATKSRGGAPRRETDPEELQPEAFERGSARSRKSPAPIPGRTDPRHAGCGGLAPYGKNAVRSTKPESSSLAAGIAGRR